MWEVEGERPTRRGQSEFDPRSNNELRDMIQLELLMVWAPFEGGSDMRLGTSCDQNFVWWDLRFFLSE